MKVISVLMMLWLSVTSLLAQRASPVLPEQNLYVISFVHRQTPELYFKDIRQEYQRLNVGLVTGTQLNRIPLSSELPIYIKGIGEQGAEEMRLATTLSLPSQSAEMIDPLLMVMYFNGAGQRTTQVFKLPVPTTSERLVNVLNLTDRRIAVQLNEAKELLQPNQREVIPTGDTGDRIRFGFQFAVDNENAPAEVSAPKRIRLPNRETDLTILLANTPNYNQSNDLIGFLVREIYVYTRL